MSVDAKIMYAQSSDIKSRTYLEYRRDMKKKAIVELEILDWLERRLKQQYPTKSVEVVKSGGDNFLWFLRKGGISREADFSAKIDDEIVEIEFQYGGGDIEESSVFDFKISKVAKKVKGRSKRIAKRVLFLYLFKEKKNLFAFLPAEWILDNGIEGVAPAWGNREVYKISGKNLLTKVEKDSSLIQKWNNIDAKLSILEFQHQLMDETKERLSKLLQDIIDEHKIVKIIPKDLDSFFKVCFILDNMNRVPVHANLWLIYLFTFIKTENTLEEIFKVTFCIDFLYSKIQLQENEVEQFKKKILELKEQITHCYKQDGSYRSSNNESPCNETKYALFSINLIEDMIQDSIYYYSITGLTPTKRIFEQVKDIDKTSSFIKSCSSGS